MTATNLFLVSELGKGSYVDYSESKRLLSELEIFNSVNLIGVDSEDDSIDIRIRRTNPIEWRSAAYIIGNTENPLVCMDYVPDDGYLAIGNYYLALARHLSRKEIPAIVHANVFPPSMMESDKDLMSLTHVIYNSDIAREGDFCRALDLMDRKIFNKDVSEYDLTSRLGSYQRNIPKEDIKEKTT